MVHQIWQTTHRFSRREKMKIAQGEALGMRSARLFRPAGPERFSIRPHRRAWETTPPWFPQSVKKLAKPLSESRFVSGHDFSRAKKRKKMTAGL
jgi:hypothetical protein